MSLDSTDEFIYKVLALINDHNTAADEAKASDTNDIGSSSNGDGEFEDEFEDVDLIVGGRLYQTTRAVLEASPYAPGRSSGGENNSNNTRNFFSALLSHYDMYNNTNNPPIVTMPGIDGDVFFYVLYFLYFGDLPRQPNVYNTLLDAKTLDQLEIQAGYFGLEHLATLCRAARSITKGIGGTGDFDLSPYSDFSVEIMRGDEPSKTQSFSFVMDYTYMTTTRVRVYGCNRFFKKIREKGYPRGYIKMTAKYGEFGTARTLVDNRIFSSTFVLLRKIMIDPQKAFPPGAVYVSVAHVLNQVGFHDIEPEARLFYAFVVRDFYYWWSKMPRFKSVRANVKVLFWKGSYFVRDMRPVD